MDVQQRTGTDEGLQEIGHDECFLLLATQSIGRLGVNAEHYPLIFPVNYGLDREVLVLRTRPGTKLSAANHANVTFEVDSIDPMTRTGWSVLVRGLAEEVTGEHRADLVARTEASGVEPWAPGERRALAADPAAPGHRAADRPRRAAAGVRGRRVPLSGRDGRMG